ncbi:MAG: GNAT family N-acetyltransferase [Maricaulaceae bacterium]
MRASIRTELYGQAPGGQVYLRHPKWADFEDWAALRRRNEAFLSPWEPSWNPEHLTRASYKARLSRFKKMVNGDEAYPFHIFRAADQRLIGACNITHIQRSVAQQCQLGYWLGEEYARKGFARAAVRAACGFCFNELGLHRIEAAVRPENEPSIKLLEAVGFEREGRARGYLKIDGDWRDHDIFARLSSDHFA